MKTITKRVDELKPGDVIADDGTSFGKRIVVDAFPAGYPHDNRIVVDAFSQSRPNIDRYWLDPETDVPVESTLTPAQEHAEEMLDLLRRAADRLASDLHNPIMALLEKIDPPKPPTLEEALAVLAMADPHINTDYSNAAGAAASDAVTKLLDRARRAGIEVKP